jgi:polysaccharide biosynthesis/export protein
MVAIGSLIGCGASLTNVANIDAPKSDAFAAGLSPPRAKEATRAADALTSSANPTSDGYKIGPQDVLEFAVFKVPELTRSIQVADTGTANIPLLGDTPVAGKTANQLERELASSLGKKYLQNPQVTVAVKEYNSQRVTLEGAIKKPGVYPLRGRTSLLQMIASAEGLTETADSTVVVFRNASGKRAAAKFDISAIRSGDSEDPAMQAGDVVVAPTSAAKETFNVIIKFLPLAGVFALL